jgi:hypothetical protein
MHQGISTATRFLQSQYLSSKTARASGAGPAPFIRPVFSLTIGAAIAARSWFWWVRCRPAAQFRQSTYARSIDAATAAHRRRVLGDKPD